MDKATLRAQVRAQMAALTSKAREESDATLCARFLALPQVQKAGTIMLYYGVNAEIDTKRLIPLLKAQNKVICLPKCEPNFSMLAKTVSNETVLVRHPFGILEPGEDCPTLPKGELDLILVPGLAFDKKCYRLGQGGGYYDRYLADYQGETVALCRDVFLWEGVPVEGHDKPVGLVLTETREERVYSTRPVSDVMD